MRNSRPTRTAWDAFWPLGWRLRFSCCRAALAVLLVVLGGLITAKAAESPLPEYQVKALFLFNFAKYVEWPAEAFPSPNSPIILGIVGEDKFGSNLKKAVEGKTINGRAIVIRQIEKERDLLSCRILFVSDSEKVRWPELRTLINTRPILTVSEIEEFAQQGGAIGFIKKDNRIRLEIDLAAAGRAGLQLSSKLLSVADMVRNNHSAHQSP
jgi:hypothetical protein